MPANTGITAEDIRNETITNGLVSPAAAIAESKFAFNISAGHNHDGVNSRLVPGASGGDTLVTDDSFTGAVNGVNVTYTLSQNYRANSLAVYRNGVRQKRGLHFTEVGLNQVTFSTAPQTGAVLVFDFVVA